MVNKGHLPYGIKNKRNLKKGGAHANILEFYKYGKGERENVKS